MDNMDSDRSIHSGQKIVTAVATVVEAVLEAGEVIPT